MTDGDYGWNLFASTGKVSDYLKYRENTLLAAATSEKTQMSAAAEAESGKTQEKERYERDLYGDGYGFVSNARG